jgi:UDP-N-acetylglucosamine:LPS N-acetylglucosamine transferase
MYRRSFLAERTKTFASRPKHCSRRAVPDQSIGYSDEIEKLMSAANVMISKLGGLTTFEALACRLPIIADVITEPMPQEAGTANMIAQRGAGVMLKRSCDIVPIVRRMVEDELHYSRLRAATVGLAIPNATRHIVEEIAALIPQPEKAVLSEVASA